MMTNRTRAMKFRHRQFLKLYLGQTPIAGNATQCYKAVFGKDMAERSAQVGGARLLALPHIKEAITKANEIALADLAIDAGFVLRENLRLYARAMGDDSYDHIKVDIDPDTGAERVHVTEHRSYDPATAHKALQSIGQHKDIQAFSQTIEHNHTHQLEQRLAARSKVIEGRAQVLTDSQGSRSLVDQGAAAGGAGLPDPDATDANPATHAGDRINDDAHHAAQAGEGHGAHAAGHAGAKRVHRAEVNDERARAREETSAERAGATGD